MRDIDALTEQYRQNPDRDKQREPTRALRPTRWSEVRRQFESPDGSVLTEAEAEDGRAPEVRR
jgi:hypothetical protein